MVIIVMGAAGAGKTTVGSALAAALGWTFVDADTLHPAANIEKMRAGIALTDQDRAPWLLVTRETIVRAAHQRSNLVLACSALRESYRAMLATDVPDVRWVYLDAPRELLEARLRSRAGHFAGPEILDSQLRELEPPRHVLTLPAQLPVPALVNTICTTLGLAPVHPPR